VKVGVGFHTDAIADVEIGDHQLSLAAPVRFPFRDAFPDA